MTANITLVFIFNTYRHDFEMPSVIPEVGHLVCIPQFNNGERLVVERIEWHPYPPYPEIRIHLKQQDIPEPGSIGRTHRR